VKEGRELVVGTVITVGLLVAVVGTLWLQGTNWGRPVTPVEVWVANAGQLIGGNPVVYRGVQIGRVAEIALDQTGTFVRIGLELEGEVVLPEDAKGLISAQSFFGDWQLEIVQQAMFPRFDYYDVPPGYTVDDVRIIGGHALPDVSRLTAAADEISQNLARLTDRFDRAFNEETADALAQFIRNLEELSGDVTELVQQQAVTFERVGAEVERAASEFSEAAAVGRSTLQRVDDLLARGEIDTILVNLGTATRSLDELIVGFGETRTEVGLIFARADTGFQAIGRIAAGLERGEGALGRLLTDNTLALRAESAVLQFELLLQDIRANPGRYVRLSIF